VLIDYVACVEAGVMPALVAIASGVAGRALNLREVDGDALAALLPRILPSEWASKRRRPVGDAVGGGGVGVGGGVGGGGNTVDWKPCGSEGHPSAATLALLWSRMAAVSPHSLARFEGWPLLPVRGGAALAPLTPHGPVVRGEGWSENMCAALHSLGVQRLHEGEVADAAIAHRQLGTYVRPASAAGVLDSAVAAAAIDPGTPGSTNATGVERAETDVQENNTGKQSGAARAAAGTTGKAASPEER